MGFLRRVIDGVILDAPNAHPVILDAAMLARAEYNYATTMGGRLGPPAGRVEPSDGVPMPTAWPSTEAPPSGANAGELPEYRSVKRSRAPRRKRFHSPRPGARNVRVDNHVYENMTCGKGARPKVYSPGSTAPDCGEHDYDTVDGE